MRGTYFFRLRIGNYPPPFHCVHSVYVVQAVHDGMTKGRISSPNLTYDPLTARISNRGSEVRVSTAVALRAVFRTVCCVFSALWALCCESGYVCLWIEEREHLPCGGCSSLVCGYVGYFVSRSMLDLTSLVNSSSTGMMSSSRLVMIPLFKRSRKASRSAVESVRD